MAADETPTTTVGQYRCHRPLEGVGEVCQRITATRGLTSRLVSLTPPLSTPVAVNMPVRGCYSPRIASNDARVRNSVIPTEVIAVMSSFD